MPAATARISKIYLLDQFGQPFITIQPGLSLRTPDVKLCLPTKDQGQRTKDIFQSSIVNSYVEAVFFLGTPLVWQSIHFTV